MPCLEAKARLAGEGLKAVHDLQDLLGEIGNPRVNPEGSRIEAREIEQVVHQQLQPAGTLGDLPHEGLLIGV
ncbi:hypothetical protein D3C86_2088440 [compost metagenome]